MNSEPFLILLADDDEGDRLLFKEAFAAIKIKTVVETVQDGIQLMEILHRQDHPIPHFIFLDLNMPRMNGLECLAEIRKSERLRHIFVAIYSTSDSERDMEETFLNGANVYITKPSDFNSLKQLLFKAVEATLLYEGNTFNRGNFLLKI